MVPRRALGPGRCSLLAALLCLAASPPRAAAPPPARTVEGPPLSMQDLERLEQQMRSSEAAVRLRAALAVAGASPEGYATYTAALARPVAAPLNILRALLHAIWAQYPNPDYPKGPGKDPPMWMVRPEPPWVPPPRQPGQPRPQRPPPHDPEAVDWLTALAELDLSADELTRGLEPQAAAAARAEALLRVALMRAIARAGQRGQRDAVYPLFEQAFVAEGVFRDECGRAIRSMGIQAVPALVRIHHDQQRRSAKMRRYAGYQLDRMDLMRPSQALRNATDDVTRAEILRAYGEVRALDAVELVLAHLDAPSHRVRREARWAWMRYVDGPPPPPSPRRKRKLPGGLEEKEEREDYLNYREMATLAIQRALRELTGREPDPARTARQLTDELLAFYDQRREARFRQVFEEARARERAGDLAGAVDAFGWILANQPDHPRRAEMASAFVALGRKLAEEGEERDDEAQVARALGLLRQGLILDPSQPAAHRVQGLVHYLDGRQAQRRGGDGLVDFQQALAADPGLHRAQRALEAARLRRAGPSLGWLIALVALGLLGPLAWLLGRRVGRRAPRRTEELARPCADPDAAASGSV
ncbi:MAG: hypothetical protein RMK29_00710 [Myxococcales bacterium]|nr:hypothetical protein [Myxococcales bacterium]